MGYFYLLKLIVITKDQINHGGIEKDDKNFKITDLNVKLLVFDSMN